MKSMFHTFMSARTEPDRQRKRLDSEFSSTMSKSIENKTKTQHKPIADMRSALKKVKSRGATLSKSLISSTTSAPYK